LAVVVIDDDRQTGQEDGALAAEFVVRSIKWLSESKELRAPSHGCALVRAVGPDWPQGSGKQ
jgi:hypothetical protein